MADAKGTVRTYRPLPRSLSPEDGDGSAAEADEKSSELSGPRPRSARVVREPTMRPFQLVVECQLGARPALCEFAPGDGRSIEEGAGQLHVEQQGEETENGGGEGEVGDDEVLRTCTRDGTFCCRVWPTASLPRSPIRPPLPPASLRNSDVGDEAPPPPSQLSSSSMGTNRPPAVAAATATAAAAAAAAAAGGKQENTAASDPFARWDAIDAEGRGNTGGGDRGGAIGTAGASVPSGEGAKEGSEELTARGEPPLPRARPAAPRRVSFAPQDEVLVNYRL